MRVLPRQTQRAAGLATPPAPVAEHPSEERLRAGYRRQEALHTVLGHGCGLCWGKQHLTTEEGGRPVLGCAILADPHASDTARKAAEGCKVPGLWARVASGQREQVTGEEVQALIPLSPDERIYEQRRAQQALVRASAPDEPEAAEPARGD